MPTPALGVTSYPTAPGHRIHRIRVRAAHRGGGAGLSWRKISTLRDLAQRFADGRLDPSSLSGLSDDELMAELTAVPGIGPWTVQGAMIIALHREDVVLPGDLALRKAIAAVYQLGHLPTEQEVLTIADAWRPPSRRGPPPRAERKSPEPGDSRSP